MAKAVLIFGATGKQGGAVISSLLQEDADLELLAVTRNASSESAQKLAKKSQKIKLVEGDASDAPIIFENAKKATNLGIWGVFSVQAVSGAAEEQQGKTIIDEAIKSGVQFFVYSSVDRHGDSSLDNPTNIPHFITKHDVEHYLIDSTKSSDMRWTILRPTAFFDNLSPNFFGKVFATSFKIALKGKPLQLIAVTDIGFFAAQAFIKPNKFEGKFLSLAGDELTFDTLVKVFKEKTGKDVPVTYEFLCSIMMWLSKEFGTMFTWFHDQGYGADINELRKLHPGLKDFGKWLETDSLWMKK